MFLLPGVSKGWYLKTSSYNTPLKPLLGKLTKYVNVSSWLVNVPSRWLFRRRLRLRFPSTFVKRTKAQKQQKQKKKKKTLSKETIHQTTNRTTNRNESSTIVENISTKIPQTNTKTTSEKSRKSLKLRRWADLLPTPLLPLSPSAHRCGSSRQQSRWSCFVAECSYLGALLPVWKAVWKWCIAGHPKECFLEVFCYLKTKKSPLGGLGTNYTCLICIWE